MSTKPNASQLTHDSGVNERSVESILDTVVPIADYTALRNYTGRATQVRITADGIAGLFKYDSTDTTSTDNGGTIIVAGTKRWKRVFDGAVNVKWFGAKGNGITDDTLAIQAALNSVLSVNGGHIKISNGNYIISATLNIGLWTGFKIVGESRASVKLIQTADNTPIFNFTKENTHSWYISDVSLEWTNQQLSTHTRASGFYFDFDTHTGAGAYNWQAERITVSKGRNSFLSNGNSSNLVWGCTIKDINHSPTMVGSCIDFSPSPAAGQPNIHIGHIYCRADSIPAGVPVIKLVAADCFSINHLEINQSLLGSSALNLSGGSYGKIGVLKTEVGTYTSANSKIVTISDTDVTIGLLQISTSTINPGAGNNVYGVWSDGGGYTGLHIDTISIKQNGAPILSGSFYALSGGASILRATIRRVESLGVAVLTNQASSAFADNLSVEDWVRPRLSTDNGDTSITIVPGASASVQTFNTTLTANRTVTLPNPFTASVFVGMTFTIVRNATVPGAFSIDVGGVKTIPANTNAKVTVMYRRFAWVLIDYSVIT